MAGDFFVLGDIDRQVFSRLKGVPLDADALRDALCDVRVEQVVMNLSNEQFMNLLTNQ